ncbi:MAG TPA: YkvA family protein [Exilispira sp.]|nr:YkvA family protein [Exilispira sp.]
MKKIFKKLKINANKIKEEIKTLYFAYKNPKTPIISKLIIILTIGYSMSPIDLIPDFIPILGYLDDLVILPALIALSIKLIPGDIMKISREKAQTEKINLKKNWAFAVLFIIIWIIIIFFIVKGIVKFIQAKK